jgi:CRISPR/Cas system-associated protein Csx1
MDKEIEDKVKTVSDWIMLSVLTVVELYIFIKMRFKIDISGTLTLIVHLFVSLIRLIGDYAESKIALQRVLFLNGANMIWLSLFYFTCELMHIKNSLESKDHLIYQKQKKMI